MRFLLLLLVALSLTLAWQSSVVASMAAPSEASCVASASDLNEQTGHHRSKNPAACG